MNKLDNLIIINIILYSFLFFLYIFPSKYDLLNLKYNKQNKTIICLNKNKLYKFNKKEYKLYKFKKELVFVKENDIYVITKKDFYNHCIFK